LTLYGVIGVSKTFGVVRIQGVPKTKPLPNNNNKSYYNLPTKLDSESNLSVDEAQEYY